MFHQPLILEKCFHCHPQELLLPTVHEKTMFDLSVILLISIDDFFYTFCSGGHCITGGWGNGQGAGMLASCFLSYQEGLSIISIDECIKAYTPPSPPSFVVRKDYHICAGSPDGRPCLGDHGGPLVCSSNPEAMMKMDGGGSLVMRKSYGERIYVLNCLTVVEPYKHNNCFNNLYTYLNCLFIKNN